MPEPLLMSEIKIIANGSRRRRLTAAKKLRIIEVKGDRGPRRGHISPQGLEDQASISIFASRNCVASHLLYRWRRLMREGASSALPSDRTSCSDQVSLRRPESRKGRIINGSQA